MMTREQIERVLDILMEGVGDANFSVGREEDGRFWVGIPSTGERFLSVTEEWAAGLLTRNRSDAVDIARTQIDLADQRSGETRLEGRNMSPGRIRHTHHVRYVCKCGAVQSQCRCMGPKKDTVVCETCPKCEREQDSVPEGANEPLDTQIGRLGHFLMEHYPREIGRGYPDGRNAGNEAAVDVVMRLLTPGGSNPAPRSPEGPEDWSSRLYWEMPR